MKHSWMTKVLAEDLEYTFAQLSEEEKARFDGMSLLITGCAGFLGSYHLAFLERFGRKLGVHKVVGIDTFLIGKGTVAKSLIGNDLFDIHKLDVTQIGKAHLAREDFSHVMHLASIASPTFYRRYPLETMAANVLGLYALLDELSKHSLRRMTFYSSSEVYGDPPRSAIPTPESYWGNVSTTGPRACYDESKRFGEALCHNYRLQKGMRISSLRLFNVYGPCMPLDDRRAMPDFASDVVSGRDIRILSTGAHTRTFCYIADSAVGELKALLSDKDLVVNIGSDEREITIEGLAKEFKEVGREIYGYSGAIVYRNSADPDYCVHDPRRRSPDLTLARTDLGFSPRIGLREGIGRYLRHIEEMQGKE